MSEGATDILFALNSQTVTISRSGNDVVLSFEDLDEAIDLFDWLTLNAEQFRTEERKSEWVYFDRPAIITGSVPPGSFVEIEE